MSKTKRFRMILLAALLGCGAADALMHHAFLAAAVLGVLIATTIALAAGWYED